MSTEGTRWSAWPARPAAPARELSLAEVVLPIPGASRPQSILDSVAAAELELTGAELEALAVDA